MVARSHNADGPARLRSLLSVLALILVSAVAALAVAVVLASGRPSGPGDHRRVAALAPAPSIMPPPSPPMAAVTRPPIARDVILYVIVAPNREPSMAALLAAAGDRRVATGNRPAEVILVSVASDDEVAAIGAEIEHANVHRLDAGLALIDVLDLRKP